MKNPKAQVSLELLIVMVAFLAALALWIGGAVKLEGAVVESLNSRGSALAADRVASAVNSVCVMGYGSTRRLKIFFPVETKISYNGSLVINSRIYPTHCPVQVNLTAEGTTLLQVGNVNGSITFRQLEPPAGKKDSQ